MKRYYFTEKFTLIPDMFYTHNGGKQALRESHRLRERDTIREYHLPSQHAHLIYAMPEEITQTFSDTEPCPFVIHLIELLDTQPEYNKVIFHYSPLKNLAHVLISKGDRLQLVNAYQAETFESAAYFLFLAIRQTIINPLQTQLHIHSEITGAEKQTLRNYFQEIHTHPIQNSIQLL